MNEKDILDEQVQRYFDLRDDKERVEAELKGINEELSHCQGKILELFGERNIESLKGPRGTLFPVTKMAYKLPADPTAKTELYNYLKEREIFESMISVNYNTLNSWANQEVDAAKERGDMFFTIPGLGAPTVSKVLSSRRK